MCNEISSAAEGGAGPNRTKGTLKSLKVHRNRASTRTRLTGRNKGRVMERNWRHLEAPSTLAASYSSCGIVCRPASKMRNAKGQKIHRDVITMLQNALVPRSQK